MRRVGAGWLLSAAAVLAFHGWLCWTAFPPGSPADAVPFMQHDHTFHFYYAQLAARARSPNPAAYDPHFMAGYAKTLLFPSSSTYPEILGWLFPDSLAFVYRLYVGAAAWATVALLATAAAALGGPKAAAAAALVATLWFWGAFPATYIEWGMSAFILTTAMTVLGCVLVGRWLDGGDWREWAAGIGLLAVAQIGHPSTAVTAAAVLALPAVATLVARRFSRLTALVLGALVALAVWIPWWWPAYRCREQLLSFATGFINENFWGRMVELVTARFPAETALLLVGACGLFGLRSLGRGLWLAYVSGFAGLFFLGYGAAAIPALGWLQPGRYTQPLYAWLCVWGAVYLVQRWSWWRAPVLLLAASLLAMAWLVQLQGLGRARLRAEVPAAVEAVCQLLERLPRHEGRVLFEELERREAALRYLTVPWDPMLGTNAAAYVAARTGHQMIGGPYLYTHLRTNYAQAGDGRFFGEPIEAVQPERLHQLLQRFNVKWLVIWSAPLIRLVESQPEKYRLLLDARGLRVYEVLGQGNWAVEGQAKCRAAVNRIDVLDARPGPSGRLVLSYHWVPGLESEVALEPVRVRGVPVPFIGVRQPPKRFTIRWTMWP